MAVAAAAGVWGYQRSHPELADPSGRAPASFDPAAANSGAKPEAKKEQSLSEVQAEIEKKSQFQKKAKEWEWAGEGHTEKVIAEYHEFNEGKNLKGKREERARLITALMRNIKPRKEWPKDFNDTKAKEVMDFLSGILDTDHAAGSEPMAAMHALVAYAKAIPEFRGQAEEHILKYYVEDERIAPRSECLDQLSELQSAKAIPYLRKAAASQETATSRSALYSLANYLNGPLGKGPRESLLSVARTQPGSRPLAVKLLAYHGDASAAEFVPKLLASGAGPAEVEAGAYVIEQLKLKKYVELLKSHPGDAPFLQKQIDAAVKAADH